MANEVIEEFTLTLQYQMKIDTDTGEILEQKLIKRSVNKANFEVAELKKPKKMKKEESSEPQLTLEENKCVLNEAAISLMEVKAGDKIDVRYEQQGLKVTALIGTETNFGSKGGNKLTQSNSFSFRGNKNSELAHYGSVFTLVPHNSKIGIFILQGNIEQEELPELDVDLPLEDIDIEEVTDSIPSSFFKL